MKIKPFFSATCFHFPSPPVIPFYWVAIVAPGTPGACICACMHLCVHADERCEQKPTNSLSRSFLSLLLSLTHTELWFFSRYSLFSKWFVFQSHIQLPCTQSIRKPKRISLGMASQSTYDVELCSLTLSPPHPYPTVITHKGKYKDLSRSLQEEIRSNKKSNIKPFQSI